MREADLGTVYQQDSVEGASSPMSAWVELRKGAGVFSEGTVGYALFPDTLEGRKRPETTFNQPLRSFWRNGTRISAELEEGSGLRTVEDILRLPQDDLQTYRNAPKIRERIEVYLNDLAKLPHAKLWEQIFGVVGQIQMVVSANREQEVVDAVDQAVATLAPRDQRVLELQFGLKDGITRTLGEVSAYAVDLSASGVAPLTASQIGQISEKGLRKLRHPSRSRKLLGYTPLEEDSIGRKIFPDADFLKDLPLIFDIEMRDVQWLGLSVDPHSFFLSRLTLREFIAGAVDVSDILAEDREAIMVVVRKIMEEGVEAVRKPAADEKELEDFTAIPGRSDVLPSREQEQTDRYELEGLMREAMRKGASNSVEIQRYVASLRIELFGRPTSGWLTRAAIEYLINHSEE